MGRMIQRTMRREPAARRREKMIHSILLNADGTDYSVSNMTAVLTVAVILLGVAVAAFVPVLIAWSRRSRNSEAVAALALLWALGTTISASTTVLAEMKYSQEHLQQIETGYLDPRDTSDAPRLPWAIWGVLVVGYAGLLAWPMAQRRT
jgi:hypothetical protein